MNFKKLNYKILLLLSVVVVIIIINNFSLANLLTFENLVLYSQTLQNFVSQNWLISILVFVLIYVLVVTLSLPGAAVMTLAGGYLFGFFGILLTVVSATTGATANFLIARYLFGNAIQTKYSSQLKTFNNQLSKDGVNYLLTVRFLPIFPFFLINLLAGLTKVKLSTFIWTTLFGIIPGSSVYNFAGQSLLDLKSPNDILSSNIILAFSLLAAFTLLPVLVRKFSKSKT